MEEVQLIENNRVTIVYSKILERVKNKNKVIAKKTAVFIANIDFSLKFFSVILCKFSD
jgi:hypothetical protein